MLWILRLSLSRYGKHCPLRNLALPSFNAASIPDIRARWEGRKGSSTQLELSCLPFPLGLLSLHILHLTFLSLHLQANCASFGDMLVYCSRNACMCVPLSSHYPGSQPLAVGLGHAMFQALEVEVKGVQAFPSEWPPPGWLGGGARNVAIVLCISHNHSKKITHTRYSFARNCVSEWDYVGG